jgi:hypothetical protein
MTRKIKRGRLPPFVPLTWALLNSRAYRECPPSAAKAIPFFLGRVKGVAHDEPGRFLVDFSFSYGEARGLGFAPGTFSGVIQNLVAFGFIDPVDRGGLRGEGKSKSVFRLSRRWEKYGTDAFEKVSWKCSQPR